MQRMQKFIHIGLSHSPGSSPKAGKRVIQLSPESFLKRAVLTTIALLLLNLILQGIGFYFNNIQFKGRGRILNTFNVDMEQNIPSIFSFCLLLGATLILGLLAMTDDNKSFSGMKKSWAILCGIFFYLALDELIEMHEFMAIALRNKFHLSGIFWYAWVIPFGLGLVFLAFYFYRFVFKVLPPKTRKLFLLSGSLYVFGALFVEMAGGLYFTHYGNNSYTWVLLTTLEEGLEMIGIGYFIYALMDYIRNDSGSITAVFE